MKGNKLAGRGGDPMKSRRQKRLEKQKKLAGTNRVKRLKSRLGRLRRVADTKQGNSHTASLMESYVMRRKAERKAQRLAELRKQREEEESEAAPETPRSEPKRPTREERLMAQHSTGLRKQSPGPAAGRRPAGHSATPHRIPSRSLY